MYKKYFIKRLLLSIMLTFITACSSDVNDETTASGNTGSTIDNEKINYIDVKEGTQNVITLFTNSNLILSGNDADYFRVSGSSLMFRYIPDYEKDKTRYYINLNNEKFVITLLDLNDNAPIFEDDNNISVKENRTSVMELKAIDADFNTTIRYSIEENSEDATFFDIDENQVFFKDAADYEEKSLYKFTAVADDGLHTTKQLMIINIEDIADVIPKLKSLSLIVPEDSESNITIGNIEILEIGDTNISKIVLDGEGNETFAISLEGNISIVADKKLNYDNNGGKQSYQFKVIATNEAGDSNSTDLNISVTNIIDEVPVLANLKDSIKENASKNDQIGPINRVYEGDTPIEYIKLVGENSNLFSVDRYGYISLNEENSLDYETQPEYSFKAVAKNEAGESESVDINISIEDYINKPFQIAKITNSSIDNDSAFGSAVSMCGDYILVGSYSEDTQYKDTGVVYLYKKFPNGDFFEVSKIEASDGAKGDGFGKSVAISGDFIISGSPYDDNGSAYLFKRASDETVNELDKIVASDGAKDDMFGSAVAINGKYVVISAPQADKKDEDGETLENAGAVYFYTISSNGKLTNEVKITANSPKQGDNFGTSVAIFGDYIVVGSPNKDAEKDNMGYVYLFKIGVDGVVQKGKFFADDASEDSYFGKSVSISGSYILVGADGYEGTAYLFKIEADDTNIVQIAKLQSDNPQTDEAFGKVVSIDGNYMVVGSSTGSSYTFKKESDDNVTFIIKNRAFDTEINDGFASSVSINGDYILMGAYSKNSTATNNQSAYLFHMEPNSKPYIYNKIDGISYDEPFIQHNLTKFQANSPEGGRVELSIDGEDSDALLISSGSLKFNEKADYEDPKDSDGDNRYNITIVAKDNNNRSSDFDLKIEVNDRKYLDLVKLSPEDIQENDQFAKVIAMSGDYIVASSYQKEKAYLYKKDSDAKITLLTTFEADDTDVTNDTGTNFGISISIDGQYVVIGANSKDKREEEKDVGSVYLFKIDDEKISQIAKIVADDGGKYDNFGTSVSISGDYIVVGVPNNEKAYLFKRESDDENNVTQITDFTAGDNEENGFFGKSIAIDNNYIIVGAPNEDSDDEDNLGSSYIFKIENNDVSKIDKIQMKNPEENDYFGNAVAIDGDYYVVGAVGKESHKGKAYLFKRKSDSNVEQIEELIATDAMPDNNFGTSVAIDNNFIVVGSMGENMNSGAIYIFERKDNDRAIKIDRIESNDIENGDSFGVSVSISGDFVVTGANAKDKKSGAGYLFIKDKE